MEASDVAWTGYRARAREDDDDDRNDDGSDLDDFIVGDDVFD